MVGLLALLRLEPEQPSDLVAVATENFGLPRQAAGALRRLLLEDVVAERLPTHDLAGARDLEALGGASMCLHLRHVSSPVAALPASAVVPAPTAVDAGVAPRRSPWPTGSACRAPGP